MDYEPNKFLISAPEAYLKEHFDDFRIPFGDMLSIYTSAPFILKSFQMVSIKEHL